MVEMKRSEPLVTIVTPSFNSASTIEHTIDSICKQTYKHVEHIVIDGGSTDGTQSVIERHGDSIAQWVSEPDSGIAHAFNKGIARACGELIGIVNADDWLESDAVEAVLGCYLANDRPDVVYGDLHLPELDRVQKGDPNFSRLIRYYMPTLNHPTCFVAKHAYFKYGVFDERLRIAMDFELLRRFYLKGATFKYLNRTISNMTLGGASNKQLLQRYQEMLSITGYHPITAVRSFRNLLGIFYRDVFRFRKCRSPASRPRT